MNLNEKLRPLAAAASKSAAVGQTPGQMLPLSATELLLTSTSSGIHWQVDGMIASGILQVREHLLVS